jgi:hypothetical protein
LTNNYLRGCLGHDKCKLIPPYYNVSSNYRRDGVIAKLGDTFQKIANEYKAYAEEEKQKVVAAKGLHFVWTERHESHRIDNQVHINRQMLNTIDILDLVSIGGLYLLDFYYLIRYFL